MSGGKVNLLHILVDYSIELLLSFFKYLLLLFRVTDAGIVHLVNNCKHVVDLNFSGCKVILCYCYLILYNLSIIHFSGALCILFLSTTCRQCFKNQSRWPPRR